MTYSPEDSVRLSSESVKILGALQTLMNGCVVQGNAVDNARAQEYMLHGSARRVRVLQMSVENIFRLFSPSLERRLKNRDLFDVQINLHAFMINLYGIWDNWAWAFVHRHDLESTICGPKGIRQNVGLFKESTQKFLPPILTEYLVSGDIGSWHTKYLKKFRDALAHRIPLYVPPANLSEGEWEQHNLLKDEEIACIKSERWERLEEVRVEQENIGRPCFEFLHALSKEEGGGSLALHVQLITDSMTVVEFGTKFLEAWHERAYPAELPKKNWWRLRVSRILRTFSGKLTQWERKL